MINVRWTKREQAQFLKKLGELIIKGYSLSQGIEFLQIHESSKHQTDLKNCLENLKQGELFHEALSRLNFKQDILAYLYFANNHGDLNGALIEASKMITKQIEYQERLWKILKYPIFLFCFVALMFYMVQAILMPQFNMLLSSMSNSEFLLPSSLSQLLKIGKILIYFGTGFIGLMVLYYFLFFKRFSPTTKMNKLASIPFINTFIILFSSHYFSVQLSSLLKGGLSIYQALQVFESLPYMPFFQDEAIEMKKQLVSGESLESIINIKNYFETELAVVISHGQKNGEIARELYDYSQYALQRLEDKVSKILMILQPLLFSAIGVVVILMYLAMLLPMFNMIDTI